jgi:hypothetical protein
MSGPSYREGSGQISTRRTFLKQMSIASVAATHPVRRLFASGSGRPDLGDRYVAPHGDIRVPHTDENWNAVREYVTEPGLDYHHASEDAF